jgi:hypothetical protein
MRTAPRAVIPAATTRKERSVVRRAAAQAATLEGERTTRPALAAAVAAGRPLSRADILHLQRTAGNRAVGRILRAIGGVPAAPRTSRPAAALRTAAGTALQRTFDVHFDIREPGRGAADRTWLVEDAMADGDRPGVSLNTLATVQQRQPNEANQQGNQLRHVIPWETIKQDVGNFGGAGRTLDGVANEIHTNWPASSNLLDPGLPNVDNPRNVEFYAKQWARARNDDPRNLFWGDAVQNMGHGAGYDVPTKAKAAGGGAQGSAFDAQARSNVIGEQLTGIGVDNGFPSVTQLTNLELWLLNHSTRSKKEVQGATGKASIGTLTTYLSKQGIFNKLTLHRVYNVATTQYGY